MTICTVIDRWRGRSLTKNALLAREPDDRRKVDCVRRRGGVALPSTSSQAAAAIAALGDAVGVGGQRLDLAAHRAPAPPLDVVEPAIARGD
jgi:hypothetical protein